MVSSIANNRISFNQNKTSKIAYMVLEYLMNHSKPKKPEELVRELGLNLRSIRYGLKILIEANLVDKYPDFGDLRSFYYYPTGN